MRVKGISTNMFIKILIELWKYFEKIWRKFDIFCRNKFQDEENLQKISRKSWRNFRVTLENSRLNLNNYEEILKKWEDSLLPVKSKRNCKCNI